MVLIVDSHGNDWNRVDQKFSIQSPPISFLAKIGMEASLKLHDREPFQSNYGNDSGSMPGCSFLPDVSFDPPDGVQFYIF